MASLVAQLVKNPRAMRETLVQSPGWEDTLEKGKATVHDVAKSQTQLSDFHFLLLMELRPRESRANSSPSSKPLHWLQHLG